jgi:hypothetical protein
MNVLTNLKRRRASASMARDPEMSVVNIDFASTLREASA